MPLLLPTATLCSACLPPSNNHRKGCDIRSKTPTLMTCGAGVSDVRGCLNQGMNIRQIRRST